MLCGAWCAAVCLPASLPLLIRQAAGEGVLKPVLYSRTAVLPQEAVAELAEQLAQEQEGPWGERGVCLLPRPPSSAPGESGSRGELPQPWGRWLAEIIIPFLRVGIKIWESLKVHIYKEYELKYVFYPGE